MCGIAGYVDFEGKGPRRDVLQAMANTLHRRGPDEEGVWLDGVGGLAHRRLSIIDIAGSQQPLVPNDSRIALVYNGELYNYRELRGELRGAGVPVHSSGDTEILLRCIEEGWERAPTRFDGMYAFAAWDRERRRLLLARDPLGKKPLFYSQPRPGLLVFGSEIKALLAHPEVDCALNESALRQALRFRAVYSRESLYAGIHQLAPGTTLQVDVKGASVGTHYDLVQSTDPDRLDPALGEAALIRRGRDLLTEAVRKRLIADVPVGAFLSGGLDSSLIVALMKQCRRDDDLTHTFSVGFRDDANSELPFAKKVADSLGTTHREVELNANDYATALPAATCHRDAPVSEPADLAILRMSEVAKRDVKVVLSGEGSDEVFGGYPKYGFAATPSSVRAVIRLLRPENIARLAEFVGMDARRTRVAARSLAAGSEMERLVQWFSYLDRNELSRLLPGLGWSEQAWQETMVPQIAALARCTSSDPVLRMQIVDLLTWLPGNLLERGDRMTMAAGLEARVPFLDPLVVDFGLRLKRRFKVRRTCLKWIVRRWADNLLPPEIVKRPKWGFRVPLANWFRNELREMLHDYVMSEDGLCGQFGDRAEVAALLSEHDTGQVDHNLSLWTLLAAEVWYRDVFRPQSNRL